MKKEEILSMDADDKKLCEAFTHFGFSNNDAKILMFLLNVKETVSRDIERTVYLRQPEVSVGLKNLRKLGLLKKQDIPRAEKGRPVHKYIFNQSKRIFFEKYIVKNANEQKKRINQNLQQIQNALIGSD